MSQRPCRPPPRAPPRRCAGPPSGLDLPLPDAPPTKRTQPARGSEWRGALRSTLLKHEARFTVNMFDVPEGATPARTGVSSSWPPGCRRSRTSFRWARPSGSASTSRTTSPTPRCHPSSSPTPVPPAWQPPPKRKGREDLDVAGDPGGLGATLTRWARERPYYTGAAGFGALFAAGWTMSKVLRRKSGPL